MSEPNPIRKRLRAFQNQPRMQAGSLIVSVFGDAIYPRGGVIWLGCLIRLLEPLALNDRLVRTAIFRLVKEEWLESQTFGRRTDYGLSTTGRRRIEEASQLIYGGARLKWDEQWRIILTNTDQSPKSRAAVRKALYWQGFGEWNSHTFLHPSADLGLVIDALNAQGLGHDTSEWVTMMSRLMPTAASLNNPQVVEKAWDLNHLAQAYLAFLKQYADMDLAIEEKVAPEEAFLIRVLLVHDFRRLLLRDPMLPSTLLPANWPGMKARLLFNHLYLKLHQRSEIHLDQHLLTADESTPRRGTAASQRLAAMRVDSEL